MIITIEGKNHRVNDTEIERIMKGLECTKEEAIQIYAEDKEWVHNEITEEMDAGDEMSRKVARQLHKAISADALKKKAKGNDNRGKNRKEDTEKIGIIALLATFCGENFENVAIQNKSKLITFDLNGEHFKLDLIRTNKAKE